MIVRRADELHGGERDVCAPGWRSLRLLLAGDRMGFSFHITHVAAGAELPMHYTNHLESVYCIRGEGSLEDVASGKTHEIAPGVLYALDRHDRHVLRARSELELACVFSPPLQGRETHDLTGSYPAAVGETA